MALPFATGVKPPKTKRLEQHLISPGKKCHKFITYVLFWCGLLLF